MDTSPDTPLERSEEYLTAKQAAEMLSMTVNAFRIFISRYCDGDDFKIKKVKLGKRKVYYLRSSIEEQLEVV